MSESSKIVVCPYCGHTQPAADRCEECRGLFEPLSRRATQVAMGPWFIRDKKNPFRPGCSYETLKKQVAAGRIKPTTVVRGPTTRQLWSVARNVPGVAHLVGYCHHCGARVKPDAMSCPSCLEAFREPSQRDELGLLFPTATEAAAAQQAIEHEIESSGRGGKTSTTSGGRRSRRPSNFEPGALSDAPIDRGSGGVDLLDEVVGKTSSKSKRRAAEAAPNVDADKNSSTPQAVEPLNFAPSDEAVQPTTARRTSRQTFVIWLLAVIIVLLLVIQAVVFVRFLMNEKHAATTGSNPEPTALQ